MKMYTQLECLTNLSKREIKVELLLLGHSV